MNHEGEPTSDQVIETPKPEQHEAGLETGAQFLNKEGDTLSAKEVPEGERSRRRAKIKGRVMVSVLALVTSGVLARPAEAGETRRRIADATWELSREVDGFMYQKVIEEQGKAHEIRTAMADIEQKISNLQYDTERLKVKIERLVEDAKRAEKDNNAAGVMEALTEKSQQEQRYRQIEETISQLEELHQKARVALSETGKEARETAKKGAMVRLGARVLDTWLRR